MNLDQLEQLPIPLLQWYGENARVLPWRSDPTPYHVWVSEIMLQQTRVVAVLGYYARFMEALPTAAHLAQVEGDVLLKLWQGLGYYNRARNLQKAAQVVQEEYGGVFPDTYDSLLKLPGVGDYTAGAVASIAFGQSVPAVDGNVLRVVARIAGDDGDITKPDTKARMREALQTVMPVIAPGEFNQALMELGATVCLPNGAPLCEHCPAAGFCRALAEDRIGELPVKAAKRPRRVEDRVVYLICRDQKIALRRRPERGLLAGLWELPNELSGQAHTLENWGLAPLELEQAGIGKHIFTHIEWRMTALAVRVEGERLPEGWVWADREELARRYAVPNAFSAFSGAVARLMSEE